MLQETLIKSDKTKNSYNNIDGIENKLTRFQTFPKTELACKNKLHFIKHNYQKLLSNAKKVSK